MLNTLLAANKDTIPNPEEASVFPLGADANVTLYAWDRESMRVKSVAHYQRYETTRALSDAEKSKLPSDIHIDEGNPKTRNQLNFM